MGFGRAIKKVEGGKLLKVAVEFDPEAIVSVKITGDFFLHPEDTLPFIEASLAGSPLAAAEIESRVQRIVADKGALMVGITPAAIAEAVLEAAGGPK